MNNDTKRSLINEFTLLWIFVAGYLAGAGQLVALLILMGAALTLFVGLYVYGRMTHKI